MGYFGTSHLMAIISPMLMVLIMVIGLCAERHSISPIDSQEIKKFKIMAILNNDVIKKIKRWEGGFCILKNDRGGATNSGVTISTYQSYFGKHKTVEDLKNMTDDEWYHIFYNGFWRKWQADRIESQAIAELLVFFVWGSGKYGITVPQQVLGVKADGIVGEKTLAAINNYPNQKELFNKLWERQKLYYNRIVENNPSQKVFLKGWHNRLSDYKWFE